MRFELTILGSGSALPTSNRNTTAQVLNVLERFFLIDCGEGTQHQLRRFKVSFNHINHILISHLHGDHFFGLFGLIASMSLVGREKALNIYGPPQLEHILSTVLQAQFEKMPFPLNFHALEYQKSTVIFEDKVLKVHAFPLKHSTPAWGFLFREKPRLRNMQADKIHQYNITIPEINRIKEGHHIERSGKVIDNRELTIDPLKPRSYAFITDTLFSRQNLRLIYGADVLYHEATFLHSDIALARRTMHATATQAGALAHEANVCHLLLGHFSSRYANDYLFEAEAAEEFKNAISVSDGDKICWPDNHRKYFILQRNDKQILLGG